MDNLADSKEDKQLNEPLVSEEWQQSIDFFQMSRNNQCKLLISLMSSALSVGFSLLLGIVTMSINFHFAGQLEDKSILAGIGLGSVMLNCTGTFFVYGFNQGFGNMASRAYSSKSISLLRCYYTKGVTITLSIGCAMVVFMYFLEDILLFLDQDPIISAQARRYGLGISFCLIFQYLFDCFRNYFNSMGIFSQPMYLQFASLIIQLICSVIFVDFMEMGFTGIILSTNIAFVSLFLMAIPLAKSKNINLIPEFSMYSLKINMDRYFSHCLTVALPMLVDVFCFEINSILIGSMKISEQFSAHVIFCNLLNLFFAFPFGASAAASTLISSAIGKNDPIKAKNYCTATFIVGGGFGLICTLIFWVFQTQICLLFTSNEAVIEQFKSIMNIYIFFVAMDYLQGAQQGILKALGLGKLCLKIFIFSFYVIGTTSSCILAFGFDMHLRGIWMGFSGAIIAILSIQSYFIKEINWTKQIQEQHDHLLHDKKAIEGQEMEIIL